MIQAILPDLQRSLSLLRGELKRRLIGLTVSVGAVATLGAATTSVLAPWLLRIVLGAEFAGAATAVRIMIWSVALFGSVFWLSPLMLSLKRPWARTRAMLLSTAVQIGLLFVLVPTHGHVGAAWAWLAMAVVFPFPIAIEFALVARSWGRRRA
jgi:O-antigen/teichoic acid export membrane protein